MIFKNCNSPFSTNLRQCRTLLKKNFKEKYKASENSHVSSIDTKYWFCIVFIRTKVEISQCFTHKEKGRPLLSHNYYFGSWPSWYILAYPILFPSCSSPTSNRDHLRNHSRRPAQHGPSFYCYSVVHNRYHFCRSGNSNDRNRLRLRWDRLLLRQPWVPSLF